MSELKFWDGSAWATGTLKRFDGSSWINATAKRWNSTLWETIGDSIGPVADVFAVKSYVGDDTGPMVVNTGIDQSTGGLNIIKILDWADSSAWYDSTRSADSVLYSDTDRAADTANNVTRGNGIFTVDNNIDWLNHWGANYITYSFAKAPKFFDVIKWTGNGTADRVIDHSLGVKPGMVIIKNITNYTLWVIAHANMPDKTTYWGWGVAEYFYDETNGAYDLTDTSFRVNGLQYANANGDEYVAYVFAHDPSPSGAIQCGLNATDGDVSVNLGWSPKFLLIKDPDAQSYWDLFDNVNGFGTKAFHPETTDTLVDYGSAQVTADATGFTVKSGYMTGSSFVWMAVH